MTSVPTPIPSRTQYVLDAIKHRILTGQLTPGQALVETELAAQFGVSKTPVRGGAEDPRRHRPGRDEPVQGRHGAHGGRGHGARGVRRAAAARTRGPAPGRRPRRPLDAARSALTRADTATDTAERSSPTGTSTAPSTCRAATRCSAGCWTRSATRPPSSPPSPGRPTPPGSGEAAEHREILRLALEGDADGAANALHAHIASFVRRAFPEPSPRKVRHEQRDVREATGGPGRRGGHPGDPFAADGSVDTGTHRALLRRLLDGGITTLTPNGNTGEFYALTPEERRLVTELTVEEAGDRATLLVGVGHDLPTAIASARHARDLGAAMVMVHQPVHPYVSAAGWVDYHRAIAEAVPELGVVPYLRNAQLPGARLAELADHCPNVVGVKYAVPDAARFAAFARDAGLDRFVWVAGLAEPYAPPTSPPGPPASPPDS